MRASDPDRVPARSRHDTVVAGFEAGLLGGAAMAAWMVASAALAGFAPMSPLEPFGDTFASAPRDGGAAHAAWGFALHLLFSAAIGVLFTAMLPRDYTPATAVVICVGLSWLVMAVMASLVLPEINPTLRAEMRELGGSWVLAHAAYGTTVGLFAQWRRQRAAARATAALRTRTT